MTPFEQQAYDQIKPRMDRIGAAIVEAHKRIVRLHLHSAPNGPGALALAYATRRAFELTELARECAEAEAQRICLGLQGSSVATPLQTADRLMRAVIQTTREELPGWTPIIILYPPSKEEAAIGSSGTPEDVRAMLLTVFTQLMGKDSAEALEGCARVLREQDETSRKIMPEAL